MLTLQPLPYVNQLERRDPGDICLLVIHCTELPDLALAREYGEQVLYASGGGNSGHYYIDRDGSTLEYVPIERVANHTRGWNPQSVGIELVNLGRYPAWLDSRRQQMTEAYPKAQTDSLLELIADLRQRCPKLSGIAGHEDLDLNEVSASDDASLKVRRKRDPGPMFPWAAVVAASGLHRRMAAELP